MQDVSELYRAILSQPEHYKEVSVTIGGTAQTVINCAVTGALYDDVSAGGTQARQIDLDIFPQSTIRDDDPIRVFIRLSSADGAQKSEWIPKGTFFIDTNPVDAETGVMSIHGFDAMLKMEQPMLPVGVSFGTWPKTPLECMEEIAARIGVELDPRSSLNAVWQIPLPLDSSDGENISLSMRTVAGYIAAMHGGNWTITDSNLLRLVPLDHTVRLLSDESEFALLFGDTFIMV